MFHLTGFDQFQYDNFATQSFAKKKFLTLIMVTFESGGNIKKKMMDNSINEAVVK